MDCKPPVSEAEKEGIMHHSYPSPTIDETDAQYYQAEAEKASHGMHQSEAQQDGSAAAAAAAAASGAQHVDQYALSELQQDVPPPLASHHHDSSSAAELQLTAQLTRDIAQGLGSMAAGHGRPQMEELGPNDGRYVTQNPQFDHVPTAKYAPGHEAGIQEGMRPESGSPMDHDHAPDQVHHANLEHHIQAELQTRHAELQGGGHSPQAPSQTHTFVSSASPIGESNEFSFGLASNPSDALYVSTASPLGRKRTKVSRACDECRRKKIRCDAPSDAGEQACDQPCSNCRRVGAVCLFSRVPQKRGPSKGYIKELADRIISIEGKLGSTGVDAPESIIGKISVGPFSPAALEENTKKRPFSHISMDDFTASPAVKEWAVEPRAGQPLPASSKLAYYSNNDLAANPIIVPKPSGLALPVHPMPAMDDELEVHGLPGAEEVRELNDGVFNLYLAHIHPTFPILAKTRTRVLSLLAQSPPTLREAFYEALHAMMKHLLPLLPRDERGASGDVNVANDLLKYWDRDSQPHPELADLIHLQTLAMMILEADNHGVRSLPGKPTKSSLLWQAVGLARSMKLYEARPDSIPGLEFDMDSDDNVAIRTWWTIVMLDRWHAIGTAARLMVDNDLVIILPGLRFVLGEVGYHMIQLANFLGHLVPWSWKATSDIAPAGSGLVIGSAANLIIESFRINFPSHLTVVKQPVLHLAYWHVRLLYALFAPTAQAQDLLRASEKMIGIVSTSPQLVSPLNHHFLSLASVVLLELCSVSRTQEQAARQIRQILQAELAPSAANDGVRRYLAQQQQQQQSRTAAASTPYDLQQLADLATTTANTGGAAANPAPAAAAPGASGEDQDTTAVVSFSEPDCYRGHGFDPLPVLRQGYLYAFESAPPPPEGTYAAAAAAAAAPFLVRDEV